MGEATGFNRQEAEHRVETFARAMCMLAGVAIPGVDRSRDQIRQTVDYAGSMGVNAAAYAPKLIHLKQEDRTKLTTWVDELRHLPADQRQARINQLRKDNPGILPDDKTMTGLIDAREKRDAGRDIGTAR